LTAPITGAIIGYFTNDLAINMLFRPYKGVYIGKYKLPFTPGLIPSSQERLAKRVSDTIMGALLTPEELENVARRLLQTERVKGAILWLLQSALSQVKLDNDRKTAKVLAGILHDLFGESLPRLLNVLAQREDFLETQINQIFDQVILELQINQEQADRLADWLLSVVFTPEAIRQGVIEFLSDRNIQIIDEVFREKSSGTYWVVANLFGLRNTLTRLRTFCLDEKETSNLRIGELVEILRLGDRLSEWLQNISLQKLPVSTVRQLRKNTRETIRVYLQEKGSSLLQNLNQSINWDETAVVVINRLHNSEAVTTSLEVISHELALILERYLEKDLEKIVARAIPILSIDRVIIDRVNATPAADLEANIQAIVKTELRAIVNLGGILGFVVGLLQSLLVYLQNRAG